MKTITLLHSTYAVEKSDRTPGEKPVFYVWVMPIGEANNKEHYVGGIYSNGTYKQALIELLAQQGDFRHWQKMSDKFQAQFKDGATIGDQKP